MKTDYLLSIIIPTKNRQYYCQQAISQVLQNTNETVQIIVQDNSDDAAIMNDYIKELNCDRIKYNHESEVLSFVENFNRAILLSDGRYLCMIGDDDGVLPSILDALDYAIKEDLDCYVPGQTAVYIWPSTTPIVKNAENGYLCISYAKNNKRCIDPKQSLIRVLKNGFIDYLNLETPKLYHGIVKRKTIDKVKEQCGYYFGGLTPDMYMVIALCMVCKNVVVDDYPVTISGICPQSGSSASATGKHTGKLSDAPHFKGHDSYEWNNMIPAIYTVETIWAETGIQAIIDFKQNDILDYFNYDFLLSKLFNKYPQFKNELKDHINNRKCNTVKIAVLGHYYKCRGSVVRVVRRLKRKKNDVFKEYNVSSVLNATDIIMKNVGAFKE